MSMPAFVRGEAEICPECRGMGIRLTPKIPAAAVAVGDLLYRKNAMPRHGEPKARAAKVMGQTAKSWLVGDDDNQGKVSKQDLRQKPKRRGAGYTIQWYTKAGLENAMFCDRWARDIGSAVDICTDAEKLRAIATLIGKELK